MIEDLYLNTLVLLEKNPRKITKDQMERLKDSLKDDPDFLEKRPVLVNKTSDGIYQVYAGNQRVRAAKALGWKKIPCIVDAGLDPEVMKSRVIKDNKTFGNFDFDMLANEYELPDLLTWGFTADELSGCAAKILDDKEEKKDSEKKLKICPNCGEEV